MNASTSTTNPPNNLSAEARVLYSKSQNNYTGFETEQKTLVQKICRFFEVFAQIQQDTNFQNSNGFLDGRISGLGVTLSEQLNEEISKAKELYDLRMNPDAYYQKAFILIVSWMRQLHCLSDLYTMLSKISIPFELKKLVLQEDLDLLERKLKVCPPQSFHSLIDDEDFADWRTKTHQEVDQINEDQKNLNTAISDERNLVLIWNDFCVMIARRCKNGAFPFLQKDLSFLGYKEKMWEKIAAAGRNLDSTLPREELVKNITQKFDDYKENFFERFRVDQNLYLQDDLFYLQTALKNMNEEMGTNEDNPPRNNSVTSHTISNKIPVSRAKSNSQPVVLTEEILTSMWAKVNDCIQSARNQRKLDHLMKRLAELPLPIHLKILAVMPDYEKTMSDEKECKHWFHYFSKHVENRNEADKQLLVNTFTKKSGSSPKNSPSDTTVLTTLIKSEITPKDLVGLDQSLQDQNANKL